MMQSTSTIDRRSSLGFSHLADSMPAFPFRSNQVMRTVLRGSHARVRSEREHLREFRHRSFCGKLPIVSSQEVLGTMGQSFITFLGKNAIIVLTRATEQMAGESQQKILDKNGGSFVARVTGKIGGSFVTGVTSKKMAGVPSQELRSKMAGVTSQELL